jgi:hypothetical protein
LAEDCAFIICTPLVKNEGDFGPKGRGRKEKEKKKGKGLHP